jgi:hypothetical protein
MNDGLSDAIALLRAAENPDDEGDTGLAELAIQLTAEHQPDPEHLIVALAIVARGLTIDLASARGTTYGQILDAVNEQNILDTIQMESDDED